MDKILKPGDPCPPAAGYGTNPPAHAPFSALSAPQPGRGRQSGPLGTVGELLTAEDIQNAFRLGDERLTELIPRGQVGKSIRYLLRQCQVLACEADTRRADCHSFPRSGAGRPPPHSAPAGWPRGG